MSSIFPTKKVVFVKDPIGNGGERQEIQDPGLTKREYFAGVALQGMLANGRNLTDNPHILSSQAIHQADSLLEFLAKALPTSVVTEPPKDPPGIKSAKRVKRHPADDSHLQDELPL